MNKFFLIVTMICWLQRSVSYAQSFVPLNAVDFCGVEYVTIDVDPFVGRPLRPRAPDTTVQTNSTSAFKRLNDDTFNEVIYVHPLQALHDIIVMAEHEAFNGNRDAFLQYAHAASSLLATYETISGRLIPWQTIDRMKSKYEYMIARIINARNVEVLNLSPYDVRVVLGPSEIESGSCCRFERRMMEAHSNFRRMLILGAGIELYLAGKGEPPQSLDSIQGVDFAETRDVSGNPFEYYVKGQKWKLVGGGGNALKDSTDIDLCIPAMDFSGMVTERIWFSSNYSDLRRKLFLEGAINIDVPGFRCYLNKSKTGVSVEHDPSAKSKRR